MSFAFILPPSGEVVYEANLRAEGPRPFAALEGRLDSIRALGANVLWLMPVQPVGRLRSAGGLGSPYATRDYDAVNPEFGTPAEFRALVEAAHARHMAVILDWVANHTAWDHPWIKTHPDWYTHDASGAIVRPAGTNWNDVADLDYAKPALRDAMAASMERWLRDYDLDGFRCDTADWVPADFWKAAIARLRRASPRPLLMLAEGFRRENAAVGFDLEYGWPFYDALVSIYKGGAAIGLAAAAAKEKAEGCPHLRFVTNHDKDAWEGTPLDFFRTPQGVRAATVVTALYGGGVPLVYEGQEVAWSKRIPLFDRSTVDWSANPAERRWLASLDHLRRAYPSLWDGDLQDRSSADAVLFRRRKGREEGLVVANVRDRATTVSLPAALAGAWRDGFGGASLRLGTTLALPSYGYRVLVRAVPAARRPLRAVVRAAPGARPWARGAPRTARSGA